MAPLNLYTPDDLGYSSSTGSVETANAVDFNLSSDANQPRHVVVIVAQTTTTAAPTLMAPRSIPSWSAAV
ncbi:hypothetical protein [Tunturiibacter gelidiferens]|uniref:hypothetical protein n=1 Tax=Tunturiibacter gelidiferens TaxID=3069689 RepID=UPI003D9BA001